MANAIGVVDFDPVRVVAVGIGEVRVVLGEEFIEARRLRRHSDVNR